MLYENNKGDRIMSWYDAGKCIPLHEEDGLSFLVLTKYRNKKDNNMYFGMGHYRFEDNKWRINTDYIEDNEEDMEVIKWTPRKIN